MSVAFPAVLVLLLVLPGIILRYSYARGSWRWNSPTSVLPIADEIAYSLAFAVGLHALWIQVVTLFGHYPDIHGALTLLTGNYGPDNRYFESAVRSVSDHVTEVAAYFLTLCTVAAATGAASHALVRKLKLDKKIKTLRFRNEWYYLLSGEILEFAEMPQPAPEIDGVYLSAVVDHGKESFLYRGVVQDFTFDRDGSLDKILLTFAHRRSLGDDVSPSDGVADLDDRYYDIEGDFFLLRYSETRTINLDYFVVLEQSQIDASPTSPPGGA